MARSRIDPLTRTRSVAVRYIVYVDGRPSRPRTLPEIVADFAPSRDVLDAVRLLGPDEGYLVDGVRYVREATICLRSS
jgi:hypothetical protein